ADAGGCTTTTRSFPAASPTCVRPRWPNCITTTTAGYGPCIPMADDVGTAPGGFGPATPMPPGPLLTIADGDVAVDVAPEAGGRIAQIRCDGVEQLVGHGEHGAASAIGWGCYPMVPWCGRIRHGQ